jgi:hypothetical protein
VDLKGDPDAASLLETFEATDTLDATLGKGQAEELFELGRRLVRGNWGNLERALNGQIHAAGD